MVSLRFTGPPLVALVGLSLRAPAFLDTSSETAIDSGVIDECFPCVCDGNSVGFPSLRTSLGPVMKGTGVSPLWAVFEEITPLDSTRELCSRGDKLEEGGDFRRWLCFPSVEETNGGRE